MLSNRIRYVKDATIVRQVDFGISAWIPAFAGMTV